MLLVSNAILIGFYFDNATTEQRHACPPWGNLPEQDHSHENRDTKGILFRQLPKVILDYGKNLYCS
jgi:hypothetical protein